MSTKSVTTDIIKTEEIIDDISNVETKPLEDQIDQQKLMALKAKSKAKQQETKMSAKIIAKKERSIEFGVVGSGQAGSRLAETFYSLGYDAVAINTASQDLKFIKIPDDNKLLLEGASLGGAAKDLDTGRAAAEINRNDIIQLVNSKLDASQVNIFTVSLGGGSGAGSVEIVVDILINTGKPLIVICVLPMESDDTQTKANALTTLSKLTEMTQTKKISNLICVDNAKIEAIYHNVNQVDFYNIANKAIVEPLDMLNTLSSMPSFSKPLDPTEWAKLLIDGQGLSVYGELTISNFSEETSLAEAVIENLGSNLLASGFDIKGSRYVGAIFCANAEVWKQINSASISYANAMINDLCGSPLAVFKGMYVVDMPENVVKVYSMFSGLSLPTERVEQLKKDAQTLSAVSKDKDKLRNLSLKIDTGKEENTNAADKVKEKIAAKNSTFGKFLNNVKDRRK